jgi:hypothetical protein
MALPAFDSRGDLPEGVYRATLAEVIARFGHSTPQRELATTKLVHIYELARQTGKLERFVIFGSYVTNKSAPNDIDIILIMRDDFRQADYTEDVLPVFNHQRAQDELGASVFWTRPGAVLLETVDEFIAYWQRTRDLTRRGIVEVIL